MKRADVFMCACLSAAIAMLVTACLNTSHWQHKAVDAGHAEFYINDDGDRAWRWKESTHD